MADDRFSVLVLTEAGGREAGEMRSSRDGLGIALIRLDRLEGDVSLTAGDATITLREPAQDTAEPTS